MKSISLLIETLPNWFVVKIRNENSFEGECLLSEQSMSKDITFSIIVEMHSEYIYARETELGTQLPAQCYNRHIMPGGLFCLGLGYQATVKSPDAARHWWQSLSEFLRLQTIATATGLWPRHMELDHGEAGRYHKLALDAAAELGISEEYELALIGEPSWISDGTVRINKTGTRILNGRAICPLICGKSKSRLLRRDCCSKDAVLRLLKNDKIRSRLLTEFWNSEIQSKTICCGTMKNCPLKNEE